MRSNIKRVSILSATLMLCSCSFFRVFEAPTGPTLADLEPAEMPQDLRPPRAASIDQIEESYRSALEVAEEPGVRRQIQVRIADLEMIRSEDRQLTTAEEEAYFEGAVDMYQELIKLNNESNIETTAEDVTSERLLYQLSKAHALDGNIEESDKALKKLVALYPDSPFAAEAEFRSANTAFTNGEYAQAERLFSNVIEAGKSTPFYENAVYMHGWSLFKLSRYRASIDSFTEVLDISLKGGETMDELSSGSRNMVEDTFRVISIVFSYLEGAPSIAEVYQQKGMRTYNDTLYMRLGEFYLEQKRFKDSADTYQFYVSRFAQTDAAPDFSVKAIEVYERGDFPSLILPAKEDYVRNYGVHSEFWKNRDELQRAKLLPQLKQYLDELSSFYHARAQARKKQEQQYQALVAKGKKPKARPEPSQPDFEKAAELYGEFIFSFPQDPKTPEQHFLMAEALYEAGRKPEAVKAYEIVAYNYLDKKRGAEAGYAALVTLGELVDASTSPAEKEKWSKAKMDSGINYADYYSGDKLAPAVLTKAAQEVFEAGDYPRAIELATRVTTWEPPPAKNLRKTAWLVIAHTRFDMKQFSEAELAYRTVLTLLPAENTSANAKERKEISERIAASMYRISESHVAAGDTNAAVNKLLQIRNTSPNSEIAAKAQFDAANYLIEQKNWSQAEFILKDFETRFPRNALAATVPAKLALVYQESKQWSKAAQSLSRLSASGAPESRRESLFLSAELYEKAGNTGSALLQYRKYANTYPQPFDIATEARFKLVELYGKTGETSKRRFWLNKLISEHANAGSAGNERSRYLAAFASSEFADETFTQYSRIKISLPIKQSMQKKKRALDKALNAYQKVMGYGVAEFATDANYKIGLIYSQLSADLMNSQRPQGLDALALEQYEVLLEEQAYPFEEKSIDIHKSNAERSWAGIYDDGVKKSFKALAKLLPARYGKTEDVPEISRGIH